MKVRSLLLLCSFLLGSKAHAICASIEVNGFYNRPYSQVLRNIYGNSWGYFEFGATVGGAFSLWLAQAVMENDGYSLGGKQGTEISILPLTAGLKYIVPWRFIRPYLGIGPRFFFVQIKNNSNYVQKNENFTAVGGGFRGGLYLFFTKHTFLNMCVDYSLGRKSYTGTQPNYVTRHTINLNSLSLGGGLGVRF